MNPGNSALVDQPYYLNTDNNTIHEENVEGMPEVNQGEDA